MSDYTNLKLCLAMSLEKNMDRETLENEFDGSKVQLLNYLMWGDRHANPLREKQNLLQHEYMNDKEKSSN